MPNEYAVCQICGIGSQYDVGLVLKCRRTVRHGQIHDDRLVAARLHLRQQPAPAPGAVPGPVHEDECAHDAVQDSLMDS